MPRPKNDEGPLEDALGQSEPREGIPESDVEGHSFMPDPATNRILAREREKEIQRNLRTESRRPFFRRGR